MIVIKTEQTANEMIQFTEEGGSPISVLHIQVR